MDMTKFVEELKSWAGKNGEQAWSIVEAWYTRDGQSRRLSLHDLHDLSKAIADAFNAHDNEIRRECADNGVKYAMTIMPFDKTERDELRAAIMSEDGER